MLSSAPLRLPPRGLLVLPGPFCQKFLLSSLFYLLPSPFAFGSPNHPPCWRLCVVCMCVCMRMRMCLRPCVCVGASEGAGNLGYVENLSQMPDKTNDRMAMLEDLNRSSPSAYLHRPPTIQQREQHHPHTQVTPSTAAADALSRRSSQDLSAASPCAEGCCVLWQARCQK